MVPLLLQLLFLSKLVSAIYVAPPVVESRKFFNFPKFVELGKKQKGPVNLFEMENKAVLHEVIGEISK